MILNNMDKFLERDKGAFIIYALKEAKIALKHAIAMEVFNRSVTQ